jgi:hypothetical protein
MKQNDQREGGGGFGQEASPLYGHARKTPGKDPVGQPASGPVRHHHGDQWAGGTTDADTQSVQAQTSTLEAELSGGQWLVHSGCPGDTVGAAANTTARNARW